MHNLLERIFRTKNPVIGALHFSPLIGYPGFTKKEEVLNKALLDLKAFEKGGVSGILIENNYDVPHKINVNPETVAIMTYLGNELKKNTKLPIGVSVLFNDYKSALSIAKIIEAQFVRVPVFIDNVKTDFGDIYGDAEDVISYRKNINAEQIAIFTDIHVKHAELLEKTSITSSARLAIKAGSDALIITGNWTGDAPGIGVLREVREAVVKFPILVGSGVTSKNVIKIIKFADGIIVSTSLKTGKNFTKDKERNIKQYQERIDLKKVKELMANIVG